MTLVLVVMARPLRIQGSKRGRFSMLPYFSCVAAAEPYTRHHGSQTPQPNLSEGVKWMLQTYTSRFKAPLVDGSGKGYLRRVGCAADAGTISIGSG